MKHVVITVAMLAGVIFVFGAVKASSHAATEPLCGTACDVEKHRVAMGDSMNMPQMGAASTDMSMGPHMKLSPARAVKPGDLVRANSIVAALRVVLSKYQDYRVAQADGYKQFMANVKQPRYHFTNVSNALAAEFGFDAARPTSLIYEKDGAGFKLLGAMYTAPKRFSPDKLDERIPLSIARWHQHVDICWGPQGTAKTEYFGPGALFGLLGSIDTQPACNAAGGRFQPVLFNWMVHVYPFETDPAKIWRVDMAGAVTD